MKFLFIIFLLFLISCGPVEKHDYINMNWTRLESNFPEGIVVVYGINEDIPLKAWVAKVDLSLSKIKVNILSSNDIDRRETLSQFSENYKANILLNGGYFIIDENSSLHVGLLKTNNFLEEPASHTIFRDGLRYFINRGAFGIKKDGLVDIAWCSTKNDSIFEWKEPLENRPGYPSDSLNFSNAIHWDIMDGIHGGPVLIHDGKINITVEEEVFFNTPIAGVQPRSAIGYTKDNQLIMMVVDGRQKDSRGVYLEELAILMKQFDCFESLNLDGGGSSTMIVEKQLMNKPSGRTIQREVMSAIGIFYQD